MSSNAAKKPRNSGKFAAAVASACFFATAPLAAQDDPPVTGEQAADAETDEAAEQTAPPRPRERIDLTITVPKNESDRLLEEDCIEENDAARVAGEIVVCRRLGEASDGSWDKEEWERDYARRTQGGSTPDVAGGAIFPYLEGMAGQAFGMALGKGGADTMLAGDGNDRLLGGKGNDVLSGWAGRDVLSGQGGDDLIFGGNGRDRIKGQNGNDEIWAEDGNDRLIGGRGDDHLNGGGGSDDFVFGKKHGDDTIFDFDTAEDRLVLDDKLWRAALDAEAVVERFAEATNSGTLFDFGRKGSVLLEDVSMDTLADRTALIEAIEIA